MTNRTHLWNPGYSFEIANHMKTLIVIGAGGFLGSISRYALSQAVQARFLSTFPFGTLTVNITGCFLIGVAFALSNRGNLGEEWRLFLVTGVLGGFTTFSAFSQETIALLRNGHAMPAFAYIFGSVAIGLVATYLGITLMKLL